VNGRRLDCVIDRGAERVDGDTAGPLVMQPPPRGRMERGLRVSAQVTVAALR
jgi:hypothetical protein